MRLVGPAGEQVGIVRIEDALRLAAESDLDLVEVAPQAKPPVCKLMDFGKYKYEAAVKAREARKNQTNTVLKEIRFRLKIDKHDYETKVGHALRFLGAGDKVKAMIQFRGREQQRPEMGIRLLDRLATDVAEVGTVESTPRIDGRNMVMVIGPLKNKADQRRAAQREERRESKRRPDERVDTSEQAPMTQSIGDALRTAGAVPAAESDTVEATAAAPVETPAVETAPVEATAAESAPVETAAPAQPRETAVERKPAAASSRPASSSRPAAAPKQAAPKPATSRPVAAPKPAAAPAAAPRPAATPRPVAPAGTATPKPAAPKPGAPRPSAPKPGPKPGGRK
ncbi:translation initiation factor IF-3 [Tersicoccus mangrovi]|uniref:translation initiation factor IF-3 n=1 Tax=Tersicoccus mangrovi TaxID=3121635 RepID=UPI003A7F4220